MKKISDRMKEERALRCLSLRGAAKLSGVGFPSIRSFEKKTERLEKTLKNLKWLCSFYGIKMDDLV